MTANVQGPELAPPGQFKLQGKYVNTNVHRICHEKIRYNVYAIVYDLETYRGHNAQVNFGLCSLQHHPPRETFVELQSVS